MAKKKEQALPFELQNLKDAKDRLGKIADRQPLPTKHFFKEFDTIVDEAVAFAYQAGKEDAATGAERDYLKAD